MLIKGYEITPAGYKFYLDEPAITTLRERFCVSSTTLLDFLFDEAISTNTVLVNLRFTEVKRVLETENPNTGEYKHYSYFPDKKEKRYLKRLCKKVLKGDRVS